MSAISLASEIGVRRPVTKRRATAPLQQTARAAVPIRLAKVRARVSKTTSLRVLIAESDEACRNGLMGLLEHAGQQATVVKDGLQAVVWATKGEEFHLIIVDYGLSTHNGIEVIEKIQSFRPGTQTRFWLTALDISHIPFEWMRYMGPLKVDKVLSKSQLVEELIQAGIA